MNVVGKIKQALSQLQLFIKFVRHTFAQIFTGKHYFADIVYQFDKIGVDSLFIVALTGLFTGMVFTLQTGYGLQRFGVSYTVGKIVSLAIIKELGPVLSALVFAGRAGSGIAAQLSSMVVTEQIDAIEAEGIDPIKRVVVSRVVACMIMLPLMTILADAIALVGGAIVCVRSLGVSTSLYWNDVYSILKFDDLLMGAVKPLVFGLVIGLCGSFYGIYSERDARGVGFSTTRAVVSSTIVVVLCDFVITKLIFYFWGANA